MKLVILAALIATIYAQMPVPVGVTCQLQNGPNATTKNWVPVAKASRRLQGMVSYPACPFVVASRRRLQSAIPKCTAQAPTPSRRLQAMVTYNCPIIKISGFNFQCKTNPDQTKRCNAQYK